MIGDKFNRLGRIGTAAAGAAALLATAVPISAAQAFVPYAGIDFGNGLGIGLVTPPSAYRYNPPGYYYAAPPPPLPYVRFW